jgi:single-strand DNA-binding protein
MKYQNTHSTRRYVGQDAKTTTFENDRQVTNFSVATKTFWKENGEDKGRTEWHRIVVWGNPSKKVAENLKKSQRVLVEGEIRTREYPKQVEVGKKKIEVKASITELFASTVLVFAEQESNDADHADEFQQAWTVNRSRSSPGPQNNERAAAAARFILLTHICATSSASGIWSK